MIRFWPFHKPVQPEQLARSLSLYGHNQRRRAVRDRALEIAQFKKRPDLVLRLQSIGDKR